MILDFSFSNDRLPMHIVPIPCLFDNYSYLVYSDLSSDALVIDPGEVHPVFLEVEKRGLNLVAVLCTHHHKDHIGGVEELLEQLPNLEVFAYYTEEKRIPCVTGLVADLDNITVAGFSIEILYTPGHTRGSICYRIDDNLFTGDTVFGGGVGRVFEGTPEELYESIYRKIRPLPDKTRIYHGHQYTLQNLSFAQMVEPDNDAIHHRIERIKADLYDQNVPSTIGVEKLTNPFFRCHKSSVSRYIRQVVDNNQTLTPEKVFTVLRTLRNSFRQQ